MEYISCYAYAVSMGLKAGDHIKLSGEPSVEGKVLALVNKEDVKPVLFITDDDDVWYAYADQIGVLNGEVVNADWDSTQPPKGYLFDVLQALGVDPR